MLSVKAGLSNVFIAFFYQRKKKIVLSHKIRANLMNRDREKEQRKFDLSTELHCDKIVLRQKQTIFHCFSLYIFRMRLLVRV